MDCLRHLAMAVARIGGSGSREASRESGTGSVRPPLCLFRMVTLCLRLLHRRHGPHLAAWTVRIRLLYRALSRCRRARHHLRHRASSSGYSRSNHDELVRPSGLGAELYYTPSTRMGHAASKSILRARGHTRLGG